MKIILSVISGLLFMDCIMWGCQWLAEKSFNILGWLELYIPQVSFDIRLDYFLYGLQIFLITSLWVMVIIVFHFIWSKILRDR